VSAAVISVEVVVGTDTGDTAIQRVTAAFERAGDELQNFGAHVFPRLIPVFEAAEQRQFDAGGQGPYSGHWAPLSEAYAKWKRDNYPGQPTLVRTGALREALTQPTSPLANRQYSSSQFNFGTVGLEYASYHQVGTSQMPARPPFDFDSRFEDEFNAEARLGLVDAIRAARVDEFAEVTP